MEWDSIGKEMDMDMDSFVLLMPLPFLVLVAGAIVWNLLSTRGRK
ncbi:hypothetical protein ES703_87401 [subsurface metagenome]